MGNSATPEALAIRWAEVCRDPSLRDLPYKIELNAWGKIGTSPASNRHARPQGRLALEIGRQLPHGEVLTECPVLTDIGVRVPDVAWASAEFMHRHGGTTPYPGAPEICVEIVSPSNPDAEIEEKTRAYLAPGAAAVWLVSEDGRIRFRSAAGESGQSRFAVRIELPAPIGE